MNVLLVNEWLVAQECLVLMNWLLGHECFLGAYEWFVQLCLGFWVMSSVLGLMNVENLT